MNRFPSTLGPAEATLLQDPEKRRNEHVMTLERTQRDPDYRHFALQPIVDPHGEAVAHEALFRSGWEDSTDSEPDTTARIMLDNWLLFGFDELTDGSPVFLHCTHDTLTSGFLTLLPRSAVFGIQQAIEPDEQLLSICRSLKAAGYRFVLDRFDSLDKMRKFSDLVDFIKVDFRSPQQRECARLLRQLGLTETTMIAQNVGCNEELVQARKEGFTLFEGSLLSEHILYAKKRDSLDPVYSMRILEALQYPSVGEEEIVELISWAPGIECRLLRMANWAASSSAVFNSIRDALEAVEKLALQNIVTLALTAASGEGTYWQFYPSHRTYFKYHLPKRVPRVAISTARLTWNGKWGAIIS